MSPAAPGPLLRRRVRVRGVVQGVGFRPFVHGLATELRLAGSVLNDGAGVLAEVQGVPSAVEAFCARVAAEAPTCAWVETVEWQPVPAAPGPDASAPTFEIRPSSTAPEAGPPASIPPDAGICPACAAEMADPADRRYRHPFITCTDCGPRFTIVTGHPYDRPRTTMARFPLCPDCRREYEDPSDRRFHAQPIACHACGPVLELVTRAGTVPLHREPALARARALLAGGAIVAVKGVGGYHLACDASNPAAVALLRRRKHRGDKPFAVLVPDLEAARAVADVDPAEEELLTSPRRPIVLLRRREPLTGVRPIADEVAPGIRRLGLLLPPTALHTLLLGLPDDEPGPRALVLTSGNLGGEPIATDDDEALARLDGIADAWLRHDRPIHVPCDDGVVQVVGGVPSWIRRSRGDAPLPLRLPVDVEPTLAAGGDLKAVACLASGRRAWLTAHIGDMDDLATQEAFGLAVGHLRDLTAVTPAGVVVDRHPGYRGARTATALVPGAQPVKVQHHHAHVAAVMAEHGLDGAEPVLGIAFDGTGWGDDGAVWGGEALLADYDGYERVAHLSYVPLPGGDAAVRLPYRMALAHLHAAGVPWHPDLPPVRRAGDVERGVLRRQMETGLACVPTSSMGRLFDAVAALSGICSEVGYEAQAAMQLQAAAEASLQAGMGDRGSYQLPLAREAGSTWDCSALISEVADDVLAGVPRGVVALRFHRAVTGAVLAVAERTRELEGVDVVALAGGVFCNALLLSLTVDALTAAGLRVLRPVLVPPNDGGLALGQVAVGARRRAAGHGTGPGSGRS